MTRQLHPTLFLIFALVGCAAPTPTPAPTTTPAPTATAVLPTETPAPLPSPTVAVTATPEIRFTRQCLTINDRGIELSEIASGGTLLFNIHPAGKRILTLIDLQTGNEHALPTVPHVSYSYFSISPDRKLIALIQQKTNEQSTTTHNALVVFDSRASQIFKMTLARTDLGYIRWLDNERLLIDTAIYGKLLMINIVSRDWQLISHELPDLYPYYKPHLWWPVVYSPDFEWVTYVSARFEKGKYIEGPVVYDLTTKQRILGDGNGVGSDPAWSADGQELAFTGGMNEYQLYLFNRSGKITAVLDESLPHKAFAFSWSPDGHYIAFWNNESLMIYDRQMDWVFDTCLPNNSMVSPDWAPNSQQFIINPGSAQPLLVDWPKKMAYKIKGLPPDGILHGWMNSIP